MPPIAVAFAIVFGLVASFEVAFRLTRRARLRAAAQAADPDKAKGKEDDSFGTLQGAVLGFLGLLLGFSFAGASSRFLDRQELIAKEANAIGTAFLRADLLDEPFRKQMQEALEQYTQHRIAVGQRMSEGGVDIAAAMAEVAAFHTRIWAAARDGALAKPAVLNLVIGVTNEVLDIHDERIAAARKHLPTFLLVLLCICSVMAMATLGVQEGRSGSRNLPMTASVIVLVAATLWATLDLDHPRLGLIRLSDLPLQELSFRR